MSRLLLGVFAALLLVPAASAQAEATSSVAIQNLPTTDVVANASVQNVPFDVVLTASGLACLTQSGTFTVQLSAAVAESGAHNGTAPEANGTAGNHTDHGASAAVNATFSPAQLTFTIGTQEALRGFTGTQGSVLVLTVPPVAEGQRAFDVAVTAQLVSGDGGCVNELPAATATESVRVVFGRDAALDAREEDQPQPGLALAAALAALVAVAVVLRRRA
jgi:hypothetical protein